MIVDSIFAPPDELARLRELSLGRALEMYQYETPAAWLKERPEVLEKIELRARCGDDDYRVSDELKGFPGWPSGGSYFNWLSAAHVSECGARESRRARSIWRFS